MLSHCIIVSVSCQVVRYVNLSGNSLGVWEQFKCGDALEYSVNLLFLIYGAAFGAFIY